MDAARCSGTPLSGGKMLHQIGDLASQIPEHLEEKEARCDEMAHLALLVVEQAKASRGHASSEPVDGEPDDRDHRDWKRREWKRQRAERAKPGQERDQ